MNFKQKLECIFFNMQNCPHCGTKLCRQKDSLCKQCKYCYAHGRYKFYISLYLGILQIYINEINYIATFSENSISLDDSSNESILLENSNDYLMVTYPFIKIEKLKTYLLFQ